MFQFFISFQMDKMNKKLHKNYFIGKSKIFRLKYFLIFLIHQISFDKAIYLSIHHRSNISYLEIGTMVFDHFIGMKNIGSYLRTPLDFFLGSIFESMASCRFRISSSYNRLFNIAIAFSLFSPCVLAC